MEALLKHTGLLGAEDDDRTDLGTLEKRLADKHHSNGATPTRDSERSSKSGSQPRTLQSPQNTPKVEKMPTPAHSPTDKPPKEKEEAVEELSDMMCSLVTNNCGEARYIGTSSSQAAVEVVADLMKDPRLASRSFPQKVYNGSTKRPEILHFRT